LAIRSGLGKSRADLLQGAATAAKV